MRLSVHPYRLPLAAPLVLPAGAGQAAGTRHTERKGALLRLQDVDGRVGWGDAAPLPGFSEETTDDAIRQLRGLAAWADRHSLARWDDPALGGLSLAPSVRFALELALLDLGAQRAGRTLAQALHPEPAAHVAINALLVSPDEALAEAERLGALGYQTVKVKVGRRPVDEDVALLRAIHRRLPHLALRADANRAWSFDDARRFADAVRGLPLGYVEEPLADPSALERLGAETGLPIALDESLVEGDGRRAERVPGWAKAVILKPTFLGGLARSLRLAHAAQAAGAEVVWSSAFESGVGVRGLVAAAAATRGAPAGLDPYRRLAADVLQPRLPLDRPAVAVEDVLARLHAVTLGPPAP